MKSSPPMRILSAIVLLALLPLASADAPESAYYSAIGSVSATYITADGGSSSCSGEDLFTVDFEGGYFGYLDVSSVLNRCSWAVDSLIIRGSAEFWDCYDGSDSTTCYRDPYSCFDGPWSCWGTATISEDGSVSASGYDYFEEYDEEGNYAGTSGTSWEFTIDAAGALPPLPLQ